MSIGRRESEIGAGLSGLRAYDARPQRVELIRARCLAVLEAERSRNRSLLFQIVWRRWIEPAAAFALSAVYLAAAIGGALALYR